MSTHERDPQEYLPLSPQAFHLLLALADGEKHGYAIKKEVSRRTGGRVDPGPGTLYGLIKRLLNEGLIMESDRRPAPGLDDERRRYYQLTPFGHAVAAAEARRMEQLIATAREKHLLATPEPT
jgi:DNA-binding PadR family transcriptional regulator